MVKNKNKKNKFINWVFKVKKPNTKKYNSKAKEYMNDKEKGEELLRKAHKKAKANEGKLEDVWEKLQLAIEMSRAWFNGSYRKVPIGSIATIIIAVLYLVSPIDMIPDFILGLGYLDDAAVLGFAFKQVASDLEKFKIWKEENR